MTKESKRLNFAQAYMKETNKQKE